MRPRQVEDRYVDTADGDLAKAGFAARLRRTSKGTSVSLKSLSGGPDASGDGSGAHRREELEGPAHQSDGPHDWPASDARALVLELAGDAPLLELVTVRQRRRRRELRDGDTSVELSLDAVEVVVRGEVVDQFDELEIELLKGDEARLTDLDGVLRADAGLRPSRISKLESALAAVSRKGATEGIGPDIEPVPSTSDELHEEQAESAERLDGPADRQDARRHRGRPRRRGSTQGPALPPRPDARP